MLDRDLHVQKWNHRAEDWWGLRAQEVQSRNFLNLDIGLPVDQLKGPIRDCLASDSELSEIVLDATNRRGKPMRVKVTCTQLANPEGGSAAGSHPFDGRDRWQDVTAHFGSGARDQPGRARRPDSGHAGPD